MTGEADIDLAVRLADEVAGAQLFAAEVRASCLRRAERLMRMSDETTDRRLRAALLVVRRNVLLTAEAAEQLIDVLAGGLGELVAVPRSDDGGRP